MPLGFGKLQGPIRTVYTFGSQATLLLSYDSLPLAREAFANLILAPTRDQRGDSGLSKTME